MSASAKPGEITQLLRVWQAGDHASESRLFRLLLPDLRRLAKGYLRRERAGHTLQPTALVNEVYLRLAAAEHLSFVDRRHFFAVMARMMRRYLVDYARARQGACIVPIDGLPQQVLAWYGRAEVVVAVDALLDDLEKESPRQRSVVEMKFYLGLTDAEAAEALSITLHTCQRRHRARRWLFERLSSTSCKAAVNAASA